MGWGEGKGVTDTWDGGHLGWGGGHLGGGTWDGGDTWGGGTWGGTLGMGGRHLGWGTLSQTVVLKKAVIILQQRKAIINASE